MASAAGEAEVASCTHTRDIWRRKPATLEQLLCGGGAPVDAMTDARRINKQGNGCDLVKQK